MQFELWQLFLVGVGYLVLLFYIAYAAEKGWIADGIARHPITYVLSLGVYATSWSFYGSVGFAQQQGYNFLTIYLGVTLAFILAPVLLQPLLRLCREYQLSSLADVFAFRYQSQLAGVLVTLFMLTGTLPYIALQVRAITESLQVLTNESTPTLIALGYCVTITLFAILFGARHISTREKHEGLVVAIAFESLVKLTALLIVGLFAVFGVFGGLGGMESWLQQHPEALRSLYAPVREGPWSTLLLLAFAAAFLLPRQFHMTFTENLEPRTLSIASWGFPLFLLLLNLAIPPILWAGTKLLPTLSADFYVLGITLNSGSSILPILTFIGGVSASSAMIIVTTLALAAMSMNHLVLPASFPPRLGPETDIYRWLLWGRRIMIGIIILSGFGFYLLLEKNQGLVQLGLISFIAVAQFLPGIVGLVYWRRATRVGFIFGLLGGGTVWSITLLLPLLESSGLLNSGIDAAVMAGSDSSDPWSSPTLWSLSINTLLFVVGSLLTRPSEAEQDAAHACCRDSLSPLSGVLVADSVAMVEQQLANITGPEMARDEVDRALADLGLIHAELRPSDLRQLRERIERNLSGLVGPLLARMIVDDQLQMAPRERSALADSVRFIENRLEESRTRLKGLAAELDGLRRFHRQVLQDLPMGVCSISSDHTIINWNTAMTTLSNIGNDQAAGMPIETLPPPWSLLFSDFISSSEELRRNITIEIVGQNRAFNLHKAAFDLADDQQGTVILAEDLTDLYRLEAELTHSERLASIGRLAAGVAHEIGNPVTAIACLSQELITMTEGDSFQDKGLHQILEQTRRITDIVQSLVNFSHTGQTVAQVHQRVILWDSIEEAISLVSLSHAGKQLEFENSSPIELIVMGNQQRLNQVFVNLLSNACDASKAGDLIKVQAIKDEDFAEITITDQGHGIPEALQGQVFEPFVTTKQPGEGTGLGLAVVYNIVQEHSGSITLKNRKSNGTKVVLRLPLASERKEATRNESEAV
jgi:Na+/proline symporter/signal transduction histidine kinase